MKELLHQKYIEPRPSAFFLVLCMDEFSPRYDLICKHRLAKTKYNRRYIVLCLLFAVLHSSALFDMTWWHFVGSTGLLGAAKVGLLFWRRNGCNRISPLETWKKYPVDPSGSWQGALEEWLRESAVSLHWSCLAGAAWPWHQPQRGLGEWC